MRKLSVILGCALWMGFAMGCGDDSEVTTTDDTPAAASQPIKPAEELPSVSFARDVQPIFEARCVDCHHPDNAVKVDLTQPFDPLVGIVNRPNTWTRSEKTVLVVPGDPEASALVLKVSATDLDPKVDGDVMPWSIPRVTDAELESLRSWIQSGAADDEIYRSSVQRLFGDGVSLGRRGGKCAYCHYSGAEYGPDLTRVFDPETGAVNVSADRGGVRIVPGDPDGSVALNGNPEGFEFLARIFLKLARCPKDKGFHIHLPLAYADELEKWFGREEPMLTIGILEKGTS